MKQLINLKTNEIATGLRITEGQAKQIKKLIRCTLDPLKFDRAKRWNDECYTTPSDNELIMKALDEIIEGYGIEALENNDDHIDNYHGNFTHDFVNMGDIYNATIVRDNRTYKYYLACIGEFIEGA